MENKPRYIIKLSNKDKTTAWTEKGALSIARDVAIANPNKKVSVYYDNSFELRVIYSCKFVEEK